MNRRLWLVLAALLLPLLGQANAGEVSSPAPEAALQAAAKRVETGDLPGATDALLVLDADALPTGLKRQVDLLLGILLVRQGRKEEAIPPLDRAATTYPLLADYALYHLAEAQRQAGRRDLAAEALHRLTDQYRDSVFLERAGRESSRDYLEAGDLRQAEEAATKYLAAFSTGPGRNEVRFALGEILLRSGRTDQAEEAFRRIWIELPGTMESQRAKDLLATIPSARPFTSDEQFQRAMTSYQSGRYALALQELAPFAAPGNPRESQARLLLGISAFNQRQYPQAVQWLESLKDAPGPDRTEALFWLGRSAGRAGDTAKSTEYLTLVADVAPQTRRAEEALYLLAQAAASEADLARSRAHLARLLQEYPKGAWMDEGLWLQGWLAYKQQDFPTALASWDRLLAESGSRWRVPALYWRGRALETMKRVSDAVQAYRTILDTAPDQFYYRLRARERLAGLSKKGLPKAAASPSLVTRAGGVSGIHSQKARALRRLGLTDEAAEEWSEQVRTRPDDRAGLADACDAFLDLERYDKAVWLGNRILRPLFIQENGQPPIQGFWQCVYPLGYVDVVQQNAKQRGLDSYLVLALIREESAFAPHAVSRAGARGLMQLMPQTADLVARENKLPAVAPNALDAPEVNIRLGAIHLADLLRDYNANLSLSLASYNAGKQAVQRWLQRFGFADEVEFIEDIPYAETRNYVKRILGNYERYTSLYGTPKAESRIPATGGLSGVEKKPKSAR
jgi:soluble lytic murein transglycosylase